MGKIIFMIDDRLLRQLKQKAAAEGRTLQDVANELLRRGLSTPRASGFSLNLRGWAAQQLPGVDITDRDTLFDLMNGR
jgi:plasmid stability protein